MTGRRGIGSVCLPAIALVLLLASSTRCADYPAWWISRGMVDTNAVPDDFAALNLGQLKWFTTNAYAELQANLNGGAGTNIQNLVYGFGSANDYQMVNLGQLKYVASLFYDRLIEEGCTNAYPWTSTTADDEEYRAANIGQMKCLFSFTLGGGTDTDNDGLGDSAETGTGIFVSPSDTGTSPGDWDSDGDGIADGAEVAARTDPNDPDTTVPTVSITAPPNGVTRVIVP